MRRLAPAVVLCFGCGFVWMAMALAQFGRGAGDWMTSGNDAQRSSWVRTDPKISADSMQKPGFQLVWKLPLRNDPKPSNSLTPPVLLDRYIGYRGFRTLGFVGGNSGRVVAIDTDLGRIEWQKGLPSVSSEQSRSLPCSAGIISEVARPTAAAFPMAGGGGGFGGRGGPARSGVGKPGEGAVTLAEAGMARPFRPRPAAPGAPAAPVFIPPEFRRAPNFLYALSSDGSFHAMYVSNGEEPQPPLRFLPANAQAHGLIVVDGIAYAATAQGCGSAPNGVWSLDLASKEVAQWKSSGGEISGSAGPAIGPDGTLYVATGGGELIALEPRTLKAKASYTGGKSGFTSSPVVFEYKGKTLVAAATKDGRIHLLDAATLDEVSTSPVYPTAGDSVPGALASWQDSRGTRWILAPASGAIVAWKLVDQNGAPAVQPGWVSRDMVSPLAPMILNGVVFAVSGGKSPAVLYSFDAATGKELWSSGETITSPVDGGGISGGGSQVYVPASDGTLYAFGFPVEH